MPPARKHQTTTLPAALRDELGIVPRGEPTAVRGGKAPHTRGGRRGGGVIGRKEARKAQRDAKKHSRAPPPQHQRGASQSQRNGTQPHRDGVPTSNAQGKRRRSDDQDARSHHDQHRRREQPANDNDPPRSKKAKSNSGQTSSTTALERMLQQQGTSSGSRPRSQPSTKKRAPRAPRTQAEKDEDQEIRWLEYKTRDVRDDGFDELLEDLDQFYGSGSDEGSGDEDEDGSSAGEGSSDEDADSGAESSTGSMSEEMSSEEEGLGSDSEDEDDEDDSSSESEAPAPRQRINPYGDAVAVSQTGGRYVPPAARASSSSSSAAPNAEQQKLQRKIKGLLNRLGDANVDSIVSSIEAVYQEHGRRAEVSHALARIIIETIASRTSNVLLTDSFVVVHATLVAALYRVVGVEFAAGFVQELSDDLLKHYEDQQAIANADGDDEQEKGREMTNLVTLASHLYNLQVIACPLVYDLVRLFLGSDDDDGKPLSEVDVESLLRIVKTCGTQLRHDDSASLRDIGALAQQRAAATSSSSRTRFMLETLQDISTKSSSKRANAKQQNESPVAQLLASMQRYLGAMDKKRTLRSHGEPLRVVLQDLRDAKTRGKWWLVGAAWKDEEQFGEAAEGETQGVTAKRALSTKTNGGKADGGDDGSSSAQAALLTLARKHGMNTDARRLVFITLMDPTLSVDYSDTAQRLLELRGPASSEALRREVVRVLLHCLGREREYNPFYALVGWKLALQDAGTRITMQFCLWDYLREIGEKRVGGKSVVQDGDDFDDFDDDDEEGEPSIVARTKLWHTSRAYGWWMAKGALSLSILRTVDFTALRPGGKGIEFLRLLLVHLLLSTQSNSPATLKPKKAKQAGAGGDRSAIEEVFIRGTSGNTELSKGLHFFLVTEMKAKRVKEVVGEEGELVERALWACEVARSVMSTAASSTA